MMPLEAVPRMQQFGRIFDGDMQVDEVMLTVFRAPASYTGEDVVEISGHGGILVTRRVLQTLLKHGARAAEPGEFTQRAFLNGKMDLTQAEAVMDLIRAQTELSLRAAQEQLSGRLGGRVRELQDALLTVLAHVEAYIDFPDEDIDPATGAALRQQMQNLSDTITALLRTAEQGRILRHGVRTVIFGAPNAGKSSLLNTLLGYERAIVSEIAGTTRDTIEEVINLRGIPLRLIDTAGMRESGDVIEREGIARTKAQVEQADLVLRIFDGTAEKVNRQDIKTPRDLWVLNKGDLPEHASWNGVEALRISCKTGAGMDALADAIFARVMGGGSEFRDVSVAINARHQDCLQRTQRSIDAAREAFSNGLSVEFVAVDLREALEAVGEVIGKTDTEDLLGKIFSTFCIGK
jgi:tRNA modification GTPase